MNINNKGFVNIILILVIVAAVAGSGYFYLNKDLKVCPEEWIVNRMPGIIGSNEEPREYFIYEGVRRELSEFDVSWVKSNCSVKPSAVY